MAQLLNVQLKEVLTPKKLVNLQLHETLQDVLEKFAKYNISSAPIMGDSQVVIGFVDVLDILTFLVKTCYKTLTNTSTGESRSLTTDDLAMIFKRNKDFKLKQVTDLIDISNRNKFVSFDEKTNLKDIVNVFKQGVHRIAVTSNGQQKGIFTQSDFLNWMARDKNRLLSFVGDLQVMNVSCKTDKIVAVPPTMATIDAFLLMHKSGLSSVAVIHNNYLLGVLSASDVRSGIEKDFRMLLNPVQAFINEVHKLKGKPLDFLVYCPPTTKLSEVIVTLDKEHLHRILVADDSKRPLSVISLTDIICEITKATSTA